MKTILLKMKSLQIVHCIYLIPTGGSLKEYSFAVWPIVISWIAVCLVITATYSANLIAFLSVEKYRVPFHTFQELLDQDEYQFGTIGGSSLEEYFKVNWFVNCSSFFGRLT